MRLSFCVVLGFGGVGLWVRIFWDSSGSSSKGNIAVSDLVKYFSIYPHSGNARCIFKVSSWIVFLNLHSGRKLQIISFAKLVKHSEMKIGETQWNEDWRNTVKGRSLFYTHGIYRRDGWGNTIMIPSSNCRSTFADLIWSWKLLSLIEQWNKNLGSLGYMPIPSMGLV